MELLEILEICVILKLMASFGGRNNYYKKILNIMGEREVFFVK
jgi:hypothetical protein